MLAWLSYYYLVNIFKLYWFNSIICQTVNYICIYCKIITYFSKGVYIGIFKIWLVVKKSRLNKKEFPSDMSKTVYSTVANWNSKSNVLGLGRIMARKTTLKKQNMKNKSNNKR